MNFTLLSSFFTAFSLLVFLGILYWAFSRHNRSRFEECAQLPFAEDDVVQGTDQSQIQAQTQLKRGTGK